MWREYNKNICICICCDALNVCSCDLCAIDRCFDYFFFSSSSIFLHFFFICHYQCQFHSQLHVYVYILKPQKTAHAENLHICQSWRAHSMIERVYALNIVDVKKTGNCIISIPTHFGTVYNCRPMINCFISFIFEIYS